MKKFFFFAIILFCFSTITSQELDATVQINTEQLQTVYKENLKVFKIQIEDYLNNNKFSGGNWDWPKIKCNFNMFFTAGAGEINYTAQVVINSTRAVEGSENRSLMINIMDNKWSFQYEKNQSIYYDPTIFNALTSFLDFYALVIIATDADSYEPFGGTPFFQESMRIAVLGASTGYSDSWGTSSSSYNKRGFIEDATGATYQRFRQDIFDYHYNGLDVFYRDKEEAYKSFEKLVDNLAKLKKTSNRRSPFMNAFFDAKSGELISYLKDFPDRTIFTKLIKIDPAHTTKYIEAEEK